VPLGNFHAIILFRDDKELESVRDAVRRLVLRAIALDGTCTGEHGVGVGKKEYLIEELGMGTVELMREIKKAIDPFNLFNPGKVRRFCQWISTIPVDCLPSQLYPSLNERRE
jgi:D-lactate dehydrogenase (cytochrome)